MRYNLQNFIRGKSGFNNAMIKNLYKMPGGASKETWAFDVHLTYSQKSKVLPMVLRVERSSPLPVSIDLEREFLLMKDAYFEKIEVPKPYWFGDSRLGCPFYIVERIEGETIVRRLHRDDLYQKARKVMPGQLAKILAKIHRISVTKERFSFLPWRSENESPALSELSFYYKILNKYALEPHPAIELAFRWLKENAPISNNQVLIHGDYRLGNVVFTHEGVKSILDWELSHIGDPMEDVGYISVQAWRFGNDSKPIGGIGKREGFYRAYEEAGGFTLDLKSVHYWEVFGNVKWAVICVLQAIPFLEGSSSSIELASLGRKTAEVELQILTLIEEG